MSAVAKNFYDVVKKPLITEKGQIGLGESNKVVFEVARSANKHQIKEAVEALFNVKVLEVNTQIRQGKVKRYGKRFFRLSTTKKAIVKLREGDKIEFFEGI